MNAMMNLMVVVVKMNKTEYDCKNKIPDEIGTNILVQDIARRRRKRENIKHGFINRIFKRTHTPC